MGKAISGKTGQNAVPAWVYINRYLFVVRSYTGDLPYQNGGGGFQNSNAGGAHELYLLQGTETRSQKQSGFQRIAESAAELVQSWRYLPAWVPDTS
jgi:hypothetical protein